MQQKKAISSPKLGMAKDTHYSQLQNNEYTFCLNCNTENETGETLNINNEPSNYLTVVLPDGYKVVGYKKHPTLPKVYFFLTNPTTGYSSFGYVDVITAPDAIFQQDTEQECPDCNYYNTLPTPLEDTTQTPYGEYVELLNDLCNRDFNFSIDHPIKHIEIKADKLGTFIYFVDGYNPDRWIDDDNIEFYKYTGEIICGEDQREPVCVNVEKMLQQPVYTIPTITPDVLQIGGNLRMGTYEFLLAYSDLAGNEISEYYSITQPVPIFDENNRVLNQTELDSFTNLGIQFKVNNLDTRFKYYKVAVIERVAVNQAESYFEVGIYPTTDDTILYTSTQTGTENLGGITKRINYSKLIENKARYEHTSGVETVGDTLFKWGLRGKRVPNLQPIVNLIGGFLKWSSSVAKETLYKDGVASSKYKGYMREEVQPFGLRFFTKDGEEYPVMPLVPRPALASDLETISPTDKNLQSVLANGTNCTASDRDKKWQLFNTATVEGTCTDYTANGQEVEVQESSTCIINDVSEIEDDSIILPIALDITDLKEFVNSNIEEVVDPDSDKYIAELASYLTATYPDENCTANFASECTEPVFDSAIIQIEEIVNEQYSITYNEDEDTYSSTLPPASCQSLMTNPDGTYVQDTAFEANYGYTLVYKRAGYFQNESCVDAVSVLTTNGEQQGLGIYHNYYGATLTVDLQQTGVAASATNAEFYTDLHKGALWFKIDKNGREKLLFEISRNSTCLTADDISDDSTNKLRYTFYEDCASTTSLGGAIISADIGVKEVVDVSTFPDTFYVAIDAPIVATSNAKFAVAPPCGCFSVVVRNLQQTASVVSFDSISFQKIATYTSTCTYVLPEVNDCDPIPYQHGSFAYWHSTETYPDNAELYDSSGLLIEVVDLTTLTAAQKQQFVEYYTTGTTGNIFNLKEDTDLRCKPIRHPKMPSNLVSPFMGTASNLPFAQGLIFPLGVSLDSNVVNVFLDIAVKNELLTQAQRDNIAGYEIMKGDNSVQKSIVANTVGFDMYKYTEKGTEVLYPNYPLNDLGEDLLQLQGGIGIQHPTNGASNYNYSLMSPDIALNKPTLPTELIISGYQMGNSRGYFSEVENHPKYVLLTRKAKDVAAALAIGEVLLEVAIKTAELITTSANTGYILTIAGTSTGLGQNVAGASLSTGTIAAFITSQLVNGVIRVGQYRLQWLQTMENLGQPRNFTSYYACEGYHNTFLKNDLSAELVRGISSSKYLQAGRYAFIDEKTGETIKINNLDREQSAFISLGEDYPIVYPTLYSTYDNNLLSQSDGSRTIVSENGGVQGQEIIRRSAVPYITLKNYIPNQYGALDSINWLTTSYKKLLSDSAQCDIIYGGMVYLCRDIQRRKHPIFRTTNFGQADMTPFNYQNYPNIGDTRFYVNFRAGGEDGGIGAFLFPDLNSEFQLDNSNSSDFYMRESSKFYLYYYGFASYLVESEINTNFRYGRRSINDQYYPDIQSDIVEFTQEKNLSIKEPNSYFYNGVYSRPVTQTAYTLLPATYEKEIYDKINDAQNGIIYSLPDKSQNDLTDPWLIFKPLNFYEFDKKYGKLISLESLESETLLVRFENGELLLNAVDNISTANGVSIELGTGGVFNKRFLEARKTELGYAGTQHTEYLTTPFGNISVDAKRGQIFLRNGQENIPISDYIGNEPSKMKAWFRQQLPFKILRQYPTVDIDNKFKGIGICMGFDNKTGRAFITKKDYIVKETECLTYDEELGFVINESLCGAEPQIICPIGYTYNTETLKCEKEIVTEACPDGYTYNEATGMCETQGSSTLVCPLGFTYDEETGLCTDGEDTVIGLECAEGCTLIPQSDGNAMCVCPAEDIESFCTDCNITGGTMGCPEGYTYDEGTDTCKKIIDACPPSEGFYLGGAFSQPPARLYNSINDLVNINSGIVRKIKRQPDGKILVGGLFTNTSEGTINNFFRLNVDGTIDDTFDMGLGFQNAPAPELGISVEDFDIYQDGRIIVVGSFKNFNGEVARGIVRLTSTGGFDFSFNSGTGFASDGGIQGFAPQTVKIVEDEKILVNTQYGTYQGQPTKGLIKLLPNGDIDPSFGGGERLKSLIPLDANGNGVVYTIETDQNGKYWIGGQFSTYNGVLSRRAVRLNQDGSIDLSLGEGFNLIDTVGFAPSVIFKIVMQGTKVLFGGRFTLFKNTAANSLIRTSSNGVLDNTFNNLKTVGSTAGFPVGVLRDFDLKTAGEILAGGFFSSYDNSNVDHVVRLDPNGFVIAATLPTLNEGVTTVLNEPYCEECVSDDCTQAYNELDELVCTCPATLLDVECVCIDQEDPILVDQLSPVTYDNTDYFEDASWTIAFRPQSGWLSYYSFKPDYYINFEEFFQTGLNYGGDTNDGTLWSHLLKMNSFQVFYGKLEPFIVESVIVNENVNKVLNSLSVASEVKRWQDYDFSQWNTMGFDQAIISSNNSNSNLLDLEQVTTLSGRKNYPQTTANSQKIPYTSYNEKHNFNYFFNRVKNFGSNLPIWFHSNTNIDKTLNPQAVSFYGKSLLERIKGNQFLVRMINSKESRLSVLLKNIIVNESVDE